MKYLALVLLVLISFFACKKKVQPDMINAQEPCDCFSEVSADFSIEELASPIDDIWVETDTTFHSKIVRFSAKEEKAEYKWYIGLEEFTTKKASRYFGEQWANNDIPITLVVKKKPNKICFPNDDGYDSVTKTFHVSQFPIYYGDDAEIEFGPIEGTYRVKNKNGIGDSIDITVNVRSVINHRNVDVYNHDGLGTVCNLPDLRLVDYDGYRILKFRRAGVDNYCTGVSGKIENRLNKSALLEFHTKYVVNGGPVFGGSFSEESWYYEGRKL